MARTYTVVFEKVSVSATQDLIEIIGGAGKVVRILQLDLACVDNTPPTAQLLALRVSMLTATVTSGSGGSSPTPRPLDLGDAAATFTAKVNCTTPATTSGGAKTTLWEGGTHLYASFSYAFQKPPIVGPTMCGVFELITTPGATITLSGTATVEEIG